MSEKKTAKVDEMNVLLNEANAAKFLGYSKSRLNSWRVAGKGPKFLKLDTGSVRYRMSELAAWLEKHSAEAQSTSETKVG